MIIVWSSIDPSIHRWHMNSISKEPGGALMFCLNSGEWTPVIPYDCVKTISYGDLLEFQVILHNCSDQLLSKLYFSIRKNDGPDVFLCWIKYIYAFKTFGCSRKTDPDSFGMIVKPGTYFVSICRLSVNATENVKKLLFTLKVKGRW